MKKAIAAIGLVIVSLMLAIHDPGTLIALSVFLNVVAILLMMKYGEARGIIQGDEQGYKRGKAEAEDEAVVKVRNALGFACETMPDGNCAYKIRAKYPNRDGYHLVFEDMSSRKLRYHHVSHLGGWFRDPDAVRTNGLYHRESFKVWRVGTFVFNSRHYLVDDEAVDVTDENIYYDKSHVEISKEEFDHQQSLVRAEAAKNAAELV